MVETNGVVGARGGWVGDVVVEAWVRVVRDTGEGKKVDGCCRWCCDPLPIFISHSPTPIPQILSRESIVLKKEILRQFPLHLHCIIYNIDDTSLHV